VQVDLIKCCQYISILYQIVIKLIMLNELRISTGSGLNRIPVSRFVYRNPGHQIIIGFLLDTYSVFS
jgi:hypothetical protein